MLARTMSGVSDMLQVGREGLSFSGRADYFSGRMSPLLLLEVLECQVMGWSGITCAPRPWRAAVGQSQSLASHAQGSEAAGDIK